jgi:hypothetical protein
MIYGYIIPAGVVGILGILYFIASVYQWNYYDAPAQAATRREAARNTSMALASVLLSPLWPLVLLGLALFFYRQSRPEPQIVKNGAEYR